jgi:hypothetical protein
MNKTFAVIVADQIAALKEDDGRTFSQFLRTNVLLTTGESREGASSARKIVNKERNAYVIPRKNLSSSAVLITCYRRKVGGSK